MGTIVHSYVTVSTLYAQHIYYYGAAVQSVCSCSASPSFIYSWFIQLVYRAILSFTLRIQIVSGRVLKL